MWATSSPKEQVRLSMNQEKGHSWSLYLLGSRSSGTEESNTHLENRVPRLAAIDAACFGVTWELQACYQWGMEGETCLSMRSLKVIVGSAPYSLGLLLSPPFPQECRSAMARRNRPNQSSSQASGADVRLSDDHRYRALLWIFFVSLVLLVAIWIKERLMNHSGWDSRSAQELAFGLASALAVDFWMEREKKFTPRMPSIAMVSLFGNGFLYVSDQVGSDVVTQIFPWFSLAGLSLVATSLFSYRMKAELLKVTMN